MPTSNVDLAPTFLYLVGLIAAPTMTGRVLTTAILDGPEVEPDRRPADFTVATPDGRYRASAQLSLAFGRRYLDAAAAERPR